MNKRVFLQTSLGLGASGMLGRAFGAERRGPRRFASDLAREGLVWRDRSLVALGTVLSLRVAHAEAPQADRALDAAVATLRHIESQMSLFLPDSALRRLNRDGVLNQPDPDLLQVLQLAQQVSRRSGGSFDVTVQPLWEVFEAAQREGHLPSESAVKGARGRVGWQHLQVGAQQLRLEQRGMGVTLNGIAQGYAADRVRATLREHGIEHALINTGEWAALGRPNPQRGWVLGIASPRDENVMLTRLALGGRCIATSADNQTTFSADRRFHHIFDPRTGYSPPGLSAVTVAAPSCALADALTKVMFVAGFEGALQLAPEWGVDVLVVDKAGRWQASPGLIQV
ncbi:MAG: FAD:protein FMN transferase [Curvibacter sp.]|nr:FAD:protein FMN transferase [Curvibacter sp.]